MISGDLRRQGGDPILAPRIHHTQDRRRAGALRRSDFAKRRYASSLSFFASAMMTFACSAGTGSYPTSFREW